MAKRRDNLRSDSDRARRLPDAAVWRIETACRLAVAGRLAARDLAGWARGGGVSETEFRLLWVLWEGEQGAGSGGQGGESARGLDQSAYAARLAVSAAQVSGVVESLRNRGLMEPATDAGDRRRRLWRLTPLGRSAIALVAATVAADGVDAATEAA